MDEEEKVIKRLMLMERWKVSGDVCTQDELNSIGILLNLYKKKSKMVEIMAEHLTTPIHGKEWVIKYFEDEVELENENQKC